MYRRPHVHRHRSSNVCCPFLFIFIFFTIFLSNIMLFADLSPRVFVFLIPGVILTIAISIICSMVSHRQQINRNVVPSPQSNYPIYENGQPVVSPPMNLQTPIPIRDETQNFQLNGYENTQMPPIEQPYPNEIQKFCVYCGAKIEPNARFCGGCGAQISK